MKGFTITELLVVMAIAIILWSLSTMVLIRPQVKANLDAAVDTLTADIKAQQTKAMSGDGGLDYGVHFDADAYTLTPQNYAVEMDSPISFTNITFAGGNLVFANGSGEVVGFALGQNSLSVTNLSGGNSANLTINQYGAIEKN